MEKVAQALDEVRDLYATVLGRPAPEIESSSFVAFPPGVDPLDYAIQEVRQLKHLSEQMLARPDPVDWIPVADSFAMKDCYVIQVDLPGVEKESLKVLVAGGECHVSGRREHPSGNGECRPVSVERPRGRFERRFGLPPGYHADEVTAKYKDGVLEVRVEVEESGAPREMKVQVT